MAGIVPGDGSTDVGVDSIDLGDDDELVDLVDAIAAAERPSGAADVVGSMATCRVWWLFGSFWIRCS